mmetsp:Transcript_15143/g.16844  ORF Transcript_15143/g.16844 Transcript_15143/m.16844 type:complete len:216 (+) Transcript_15143:3-650(+)
MSSLSTQHKLLFQAIWAKQVITEDDLIELSNTIWDSLEIPRQDSEVLVYDLNDKLKPLSFEIRKTKSIATGQVYWAVVNNLNDVTAQQFGSSFTHLQDQYYKKILHLLLSEMAPISITDAINENPASMTKREAEEQLSKFVEKMWFEMKDEDTVTLGVRTIVEMRNYKFGDKLLSDLQQNFGEDRQEDEQDDEQEDEQEDEQPKSASDDVFEFGD